MYIHCICIPVSPFSALRSCMYCEHASRDEQFVHSIEVIHFSECPLAVLLYVYAQLKYLQYNYIYIKCFPPSYC